MINEQLLADLKDKNFRVRVQAVDTLVKSGDPAAVDVLLKTFADSSYTVRKHAAVGLARYYREPRVLDALINEIKHCDNYNYSRSLHNAFVKYGKAAIPFLLEKLDDPDERVREFAARFLAEKKVKGAFSPLLKQLWGQVPAIRNLTKTGVFNQVQQGGLTYGEHVGEFIQLLNNLVQFKDPAVLDLLFAAYVPNGLLNATVVQAVANFDDARVAPWLKQRLQDTDDEVRFEAAQALQQRGDPDLEALIADDLMVKLRMQAQQMFQSIQQQKSVEGLQAMAEQLKTLQTDDLNTQGVLDRMQLFLRRFSKDEE